MSKIEGNTLPGAPGDYDVVVQGNFIPREFTKPDEADFVSCCVHIAVLFPAEDNDGKNLWWRLHMTDRDLLTEEARPSYGHWCVVPDLPGRVARELRIMCTRIAGQLDRDPERRRLIHGHYAEKNGLHQHLLIVPFIDELGERMYRWGGSLPEEDRNGLEEGASCATFVVVLLRSIAHEMGLDIPNPLVEESGWPIPRWIRPIDVVCMARQCRPRAPAVYHDVQHACADLFEEIHAQLYP
jgi:hypothetical protein